MIRSFTPKSLSTAALKSLLAEVDTELKTRSTAKKFKALEARLIPIPAPEWKPGGAGALTATEAARFAGGFFTEKCSTGATRGLYGKTKSGVVYRWREQGRFWTKILSA